MSKDTRPPHVKVIQDALTDICKKRGCAGAMLIFLHEENNRVETFASIKPEISPKSVYDALLELAHAIENDNYNFTELPDPADN